MRYLLKGELRTEKSPERERERERDLHSEETWRWDSAKEEDKEKL